MPASVGLVLLARLAVLFEPCTKQCQGLPCSAAFFCSLWISSLWRGKRSDTERQCSVLQRVLCYREFCALGKTCFIGAFHTGSVFDRYTSECNLISGDCDKFPFLALNCVLLVGGLALSWIQLSSAVPCDPLERRLGCNLASMYTSQWWGAAQSALAGSGFGRSLLGLNDLSRAQCGCWSVSGEEERPQSPPQVPSVLLRDQQQACKTNLPSCLKPSGSSS